MEQHPVPQNITGFQFKLIGDMTIRQFLYLGGGILSAYVVLQFGLPVIIKWFIAANLAAAGFAFAFIPIEERPLDRWLTSFFKSIYSPTQFLWKKRAVPPQVLTMVVAVAQPPTPETMKKEQTAAQVEEYLLTLPGASLGELDKQEESFLQKIASSFETPPLITIPAGQPLSSPPPPPVTPVSPSEEKIIPRIFPDQPLVEVKNVPPAGQTPPPPPAPKPTQPTTPPTLGQKTEELTSKINALQKELSAQTITRQRFLEIQGQLLALLEEKENLTTELVELKKKLAKKEEPTVKPAAVARAQEEQTVKIVATDLAAKFGMPNPPTTPNIISGMVRTQKQGILPGIILEIRNQEGTPVRALKTGKLGQFAVSTPLPNGLYTLRLEDPQHRFLFDLIEITLKGEIVSPIEIMAKTTNDLVKEDLKKKLFGPDNF